MALIGYARVSTEEQNEARQLALFEEKGVDKYYLDKLSGKDTNRPQLKAMLDYVREGDTVIVAEYSRLARSTQDLLSIVQQLKDKGVQIISDKEQLDSTTAQGRLMLTVFAALAEFEREVTLQRQREGIAIAKANGKYNGRQPIKVDEAKFAKLYQLWKNDEITAVEFQKRIGLKANTFYRRVKAYEYNTLDLDSL